jgi:hypothetical protein
MVRIAAFAASAVLLLGALASLQGRDEPSAPRTTAAAKAPPPRGATAGDAPASPGAAAAEGPASPGATAGGAVEARASVRATAAPRASEPPAREDPEALSAWFEAQLRSELAHGASARRSPPTAWPAADAAPVRRVSAGAGPAGRRAPPPGIDPARVDWAYLDAVFAGRVSGIPSETRAGLSLREMDRLGSIPYVETLRAEGRLDELRTLGFEDEPAMVPWPVCQRTGNCRRDDDGDPIL